MAGETSRSGAGGSDSYHMCIAKRSEPIWKNTVDGGGSGVALGRVAPGNGNMVLVFFFLFIKTSLSPGVRHMITDLDRIEHCFAGAPGHDYTSGPLLNRARKHGGNRGWTCLFRTSE